MTDSILTSTKKNLDLAEDYTVYDDRIIDLINTAFATLNQLGIGPENGYAIEDASATWASFFGTNLRYNPIKTYVFLSAKLIFDPPQTSYLQKAMQDQKLEFEVRLNYIREGTDWVDPDPDPIPVENEMVLYGGDSDGW